MTSMTNLFFGERIRLTALRSGDAVEAERTYQEVLELMYRHAR